MSEKKQTNLRVFKLRSGEEIVAELIGKVTGKVIVSRPMKINNSIVADPFTGVRKKIMYLNDWLGNSNEIQITLPNNFIVLDLSPDPSVISLYNKQLDLDDVASIAPPPTVANPPDIFPELTEKDMKDLSDSVIEQYDKLKDEAKNSKDDKNPPLGYWFEDLMNASLPPKASNSIEFSFSIPPSILQNWIESGFVDYMKDCAQEFMCNEFLEDFLEEEEEYLKAKKDKKAKSKKTNKSASEPISKKEWKEPSDEDKTKKGFGNDLKDWSPNLSDYIDTPPKIDPPSTI